MSYKKILLLFTFFVAGTINMSSTKAATCITDAMQREADQLQIYSTFNESTKTYDVTVEGLTSGDIFVYLTDGNSEYQFIKKPEWLENFSNEEAQNRLDMVDENDNVIHTIYYEDNKAIIRGINAERYTAIVRPSTNTGCSDTIKSEKLSLQSYNIYADDPRCVNIDIEEFPMCDPWYEGNIDENTFTESYNKYLDELNPTEQPEKPEIQEKVDIGEEILNFLSKYYIHIIVGVVIVVIIGTIIQALVRRRKKPGDLL